MLFNVNTKTFNSSNIIPFFLQSPRNNIYIFYKTNFFSLEFVG